MADLDDGGVDFDLRKAWDAALFEATTKPYTLLERAEALDYELSRIEQSLRVGYLARGRDGFPVESMQRVGALRMLLDLVYFLDRNAKDEKLADRLKQLKKAESYGDKSSVD